MKKGSLLLALVIIIGIGACKKTASKQYCYRLYNWDSRYLSTNIHDTINTFDSSGVFCFDSYQGDTIQRVATHDYSITHESSGTYYAKDSGFKVYQH